MGVVTLGPLVAIAWLSLVVLLTRGPFAFTAPISSPPQNPETIIMHNETSLGREDGEAMPSATSTTKIIICPTCLDKRGQNYLVSIEGQTLIAKTRNPTADACRRLVALGRSGRLEVWREGRIFPCLVIADIGKAAGMTVAENTAHGPRFAPYQAFAASTLAAQEVA